MTYIITGATSFIGQELCTYLLSQGSKIYAIYRKDSPKVCCIPISNNLKKISLDLAEINNLVDIIDEADVFINLAWAGTNHEGRNNLDIQNSNVENTLRAMKVAKQLGCSLFVESGSQAEYGFVSEIITEDTPCNPETEYGKAKLEVWNKGKILSKELGIKYLHLRIFSLYGENDHPWTLIISSVEKMLRNESLSLSSCEQYWNFLYIKDAVFYIDKLCQYAINKKDYTSDIFNIASDLSQPLKDFVLRMKLICKSSSYLGFGEYLAKSKVSLRPSVNKLIVASKSNCFTNFDEVILRIIQSYKK